MSAPATGWREGADTLDRYGPISSLPELHPDRETNLEILLDAMVARLDVARAALGKVSALNVVEPALVEAKRAAAWALEETSPARVLPRSARYDEAAAPSPTDWPSEEAVERAAFEAWAEREHAYSLQTLRRPDGAYWTQFTALAWLAWHARAALVAAPSPQVESDVMDMFLCESRKLVLHEGQTYRFRRDPECDSCRAYGNSPVASTGAREAVAWRWRNALGEIVTEWIDGPPRPWDYTQVADANGTIETAYAAPSSGSTE